MGDRKKLEKEISNRVPLLKFIGAVNPDLLQKFKEGRLKSVPLRPLSESSQNWIPLFADLETDPRYTKGEGWIPTPENINVLPGGLREYIYLLETRADPAGEVRELMIAKDTIRSLEARISELAQLEPEPGEWFIECLRRCEHDGQVVTGLKWVPPCEEEGCPGYTRRGTENE